MSIRCRFASQVASIILLVLLVSMEVHAPAAAAPPAAPVPAAPEAQVEETRRVTVHVTVKSDDKPVADVPFTAQYDRCFGQGATDAHGRAVLEVEVPASARMVAVYPRPWPSSGGRVLNITQQREQYLQLIAPYAFANWYRVGLRPKEGSYELPIVVSHARTATLHVDPPERPGWGANAISRNCTSKLNLPDADGRIIVPGLPKDKPSVVYVVTTRFVGRIARVEVPAGEADVDLGKITIPPDTDPLGEASITFQPSRAPLWRPDSTADGVTLVSLDGGRIEMFVRRQKISEAGPPIPSDSIAVKVPPGEYYVVGGLFGATPAQASLVERARAGEDLRKLGVPTVIVSTDHTAELELDQWKVESLILGGEDNTDRPDYTPPGP